MAAMRIWIIPGCILNTMITINEVPLYTSCLFPSMPAAAKPKEIAGEVANPNLPTKKISLGPNLPLKTSLSCLSVKNIDWHY